MVGGVGGLNLTGVGEGGLVDSPEIGQASPSIELTFNFLPYALNPKP